MAGLTTQVTGQERIIDGRSIWISIAGLFGGPVSADIAAVMAAVYRAWLVGAGGIIGVSVIAESALVGVAWHSLRGRHEVAVYPFGLLSFGVLVHVLMLALTSTLPSDQAATVLRQIAIPVMTLHPVATMRVGMLFLDQEVRLQARTGIGLALVKKIIEGYSGKAEPKSDVGQGRVFSFTLPQ